MEIQCQGGQVIDILEGWYGKFGRKSGSCEEEEALGTKKCGVDATSSLEAICGGSYGCQVFALDNQFPEINDCPDNNTHLMMKYRCVPHNSKWY